MFLNRKERKNTLLCLSSVLVLSSHPVLISVEKQCLFSNLTDKYNTLLYSGVRDSCILKLIQIPLIELLHTYCFTGLQIHQCCPIMILYLSSPVPWYALIKLLTCFNEVDIILGPIYMK